MDRITLQDLRNAFHNAGRYAQAVGVTTSTWELDQPHDSVGVTGKILAHNPNRTKGRVMVVDTRLRKTRDVFNWLNGAAWAFSMVKSNRERADILRPRGMCDTPNCNRDAVWISVYEVQLPAPAPRRCVQCCDAIGAVMDGDRFVTRALAEASGARFTS